ncbi:MAG: YkgJ family cysteine cluster protein [Alphaproteobacteria bacterium]|nr:YkgJ family cysteine cluster protein [Alphaproteobacteria bacterium]
MSPPQDILRRPMASARLRLADGDMRIEVPIQVPSDAVAAIEVLPAVHRLQDALVDAAQQRAARRGQAISCRRGCAACCRQPVALIDIEAWALAALVERLPEPRRSTVRARFAAALERLDAAGLKNRLAEAGDAGTQGGAIRALSLDAFALGIACPFLEDEACSIYADRPLACRQHVVTTPAERCAEPGKGEIAALPATSLSAALQGLLDGGRRPRRRWVPLALALEWAAAHKPPAERQPGPAWIERLLKALADSAGTVMGRH